MGKFTGVLLASDFDNTLIYTEEALRSGGPVPPLPERNREALDYFIREGGAFSIATGRALAAFARYADMVPMNAPGVVCNGAALYNFQKQEYLDALVLDELAALRGQDLLDRFPDLAVEAYHIGNVIHAVRPNDAVRRHERLTQVSVVESPSLPEVPQPLGKLLWEADHETLQAAADYLRRQPWAGEYELIFSGKTLLEMTAKGANKGGMIRRLARRLGISMDHVYCAGDEANDIPMLTAAARGFAPANCVETVRSCGATLVADAREGALADVVSVLDGLYP